MTEPTRVISSTAHLTPDGILGYAKGAVALVALILQSVVIFLPEDWRPYVWAVVALLGTLWVAAVPNKVKPVAVVAPPVDLG